MDNKQYHLRYLPLFEQDLIEAVNYITDVLKNGEAALSLVDEVEQAIQNRLFAPYSFEPYYSARERKYPYYPIYVKNYIVYYVMIDDVMEIRRFLYNRRDMENFLI